MKNATMLVIALLALASCSKKGEGDHAGAAAVAKMTELEQAMCACKDAQCAQAVSDKLTAWTQEQAKNQKGLKLSAEDTKKAAAISAQLGTCMQAAMSVEGATSGSAEAAATGSAAEPIAGLPAECTEYRAQVEKLKTCAELPDKAKDALVTAYDDASAGWATMPDGAKAGLATSCKRGTEALVAAAQEACGW